MGRECKPPLLDDQPWLEDLRLFIDDDDDRDEDIVESLNFLDFLKIFENFSGKYDIV